MSHEMLNSFVVGLSALVVVLLGFFAQQWSTNLMTSIADLSTSIKKLAESFNTMEMAMLGFERDLDDHASAIEYLSTRRCANPDCTHYNTSDEPIRLFQHRRGEVKRD